MNLIAQNPDFFYMVEQAIKAPSGHNTQPWKFKLNESSIVIYPNYSKSLPVVDANHRELFISLGCAAENLRISASSKGYDSKVAVSEAGVITIQLKKTGEGHEHQLQKSIPLRQTNRSVYKGKTIPADTLALLQNLSLDKNIGIRLYANGTDEFNTIKLFVMRSNELQMRDKAFKDELKAWIRVNKSQTNSTCDGLSYESFGAPNLPAFISKPIFTSFFTPEKQNKGDLEKIKSSSHFALFSTYSNSIAEWVKLGMYLERFLLESTRLGIASAFTNQPCEIAELATEMSEILGIAGEYPAVMLRLGYSAPIPYSKRKDINEVLVSE